MKTILTIGDNKDFDSFAKFVRQRRLFHKHKYFFKTVDYTSLLEENLPQIETDELIVFLFFPFVYWEENIETKKSKEIYGTRDFYDKFKKFWKRINKKLTKFYANKKIHFVNLPQDIYKGRDKATTKRILSKAGISVPKKHTMDYKKILKMVDVGKKLFIKVRYGSMGKGITYLEKKCWLTNFRFKNNRIISKKSDYGWTFSDITENNKFLRLLLKQDVIVEDAIDPYLLKGRKFDLRVYVAFGRVLYIYPRSNECDKVTTNISQGGRGEDKHYIESIPPKILEQAKKNAVISAKAMGLNFAGVDILPDVDQNAIVIEVNSFPGFPSTKVRKNRFNLSKYLIEEITRQKWK